MFLLRPRAMGYNGARLRNLQWVGCRKCWILVQSPEKNYFSHLLKKCYLLKEKIMGLYLGGAHHRAYYYCFGGTKKECLYFLCCAADNQDIAPEFFPLRDNIFLANVKSSFFSGDWTKIRHFLQPTQPKHHTKFQPSSSKHLEEMAHTHIHTNIKHSTHCELYWPTEF